ncbi:MAG TPA: hypothetical protein VMZ31_01210 [Phycisphaerae bacterium]|nr:hypothetical protein [Phycisphaerae bacterium]
MCRSIGLWPGALLLIVMALGCEPKSQDRRPQQPAAPPDPVAVLRDLRRCHHARQYRQMERLVVEGRRNELIDALMGVDQLLAANRRLKELVAERIGPEAAPWWDLSLIENGLGPFSRDVDVVAVQVDGPHASVTIQVAQRVPLLEMEFVREPPGPWRYVPDPPIPGMAEQLRELARNLDSLADQLKDSTTTPEQFERSFRRQVLPLLRSLGQMDDE